MGINAVWKSEGGDELGFVGDARGVLSSAVGGPELAHTVCVRFIDPYGDTVFNQVQLPVLIEELEALARDSEDTETREHLTRVVMLARKATERIHSYLWFIGD